MLVDPERIEGTNSPRAVGATRWNGRTWLLHERWPQWVRTRGERTATPKVKMAARIIRAANPRAVIEPLHTDLLQPEITARLLNWRRQDEAALRAAMTLPRAPMEGGQGSDGLPEIPVTRPPPHVALVATSGMNRSASCGASWRRSDRSRDGASAPLSGTGRH